MKKNFFTRLYAREILKRTPITHEILKKTHFEREGLQYKMGDLVIRQIGAYFFFKNIEGHLEKINNANELSNLVYGKTPYSK